MDYNKIRKRPTQWLSLTGMTIEEFDALLPCFSFQWEEYTSHYTLEGKLRQRICYTRVCSILSSMEIKLFFILVFCKTNPLQEHHAACFGITQPQANKMIHLLLKLLHKTLKELQMLPEGNAMKLNQTVKGLSDVLLDGTERPIQRSCDYELQKEQFSGKKKKHCIKNNVLTDMNGKILFLSQPYNGSVHDKKICDLQPLSLPCGINLWQDTGFIGHNPQGVIIRMPFKKPKGKELTDEQKISNKQISSKRVYVEHAIGRVKVYRIVKDCLRCHKFGIDDLVMQIACALINLKLSMNINLIAA